MKPKAIRVIAICLFTHDDRILVFEAFDSVKSLPFYRPLGGGVEPGETTEQALVREIQEELAQDITQVHLVGVLENLFECNGVPGHEIVFIYDARFVDDAIYERDALLVREDNGDVITARWRRLDEFDGYHRLVPEQLTDLIQGWALAASDTGCSEG